MSGNNEGPQRLAEVSRGVFRQLNIDFWVRFFKDWHLGREYLKTIKFRLNPAGFIKLKHNKHLEFCELESQFIPEWQSLWIRESVRLKVFE
jgi:hypothetical protein